MELSFLTEHYVPVVMAACLVAGYCIKHISWLDTVGNEYIPSILAALGAVLGCVAAGGVSLENVVYGAVTGLASTGLHQAFSQLLGLNQEK